MSEKKKSKLNIFRTFMGLVVVILASAAVASYALGWVSFHQGNGTFVIEVRTGKAKQDTDTAVKQTKEAAAETGKALQTAGKKLEEINEDEPTTTEPTKNKPANAEASSPAVDAEGEKE